MQAERTAWGVLGAFHVLGNTSFWTQQDTAFHRIWWSPGQRTRVLSLAPPAPPLITFVLSHYSMHAVAQRTVRVAACREACPALLLLSVRSSGVVSAVVLRFNPAGS